MLVSANQRVLYLEKKRDTEGHGIDAQAAALLVAPRVKRRFGGLNAASVLPRP